MLSLAGDAEGCRGVVLPSGERRSLPRDKDGPESRQHLDETPGRTLKHYDFFLEETPKSRMA